MKISYEKKIKIIYNKKYNIINARKNLTLKCETFI